MPETVEVDNKIYCLQYSESYSGSLVMSSNNRPFVTLEHALHQIFSSSLLKFRTALLTIGSNTVAIFSPFPYVFKVFDSHSKDSYGMLCAFGNCILSSIEGLQNLVAYFQQTSCSQGILPFELKGVACTLNYTVNKATMHQIILETILKNRIKWVKNFLTFKKDQMSHRNKDQKD